MKYEINLYEGDKRLRFVLGNVKENPLVVIGLNPSYADKNKSDRTITKIMGFAENNGFDGFVMINLYPFRTSNPDELPKEPLFNPKIHKSNIKHIDTVISKIINPSIVAAWGNTIIIRDYFNKCLQDIYDILNKYNISWLNIGQLTKAGHPRHPSRAPYKFNLKNFNIKEYIKP